MNIDVLTPTVGKNPESSDGRKGFFLAFMPTSTHFRH
jgi:hypothetical protein